MLSACFNSRMHLVSRYQVKTCYNFHAARPTYLPQPSFIEFHILHFLNYSVNIPLHQPFYLPQDSGFHLFFLSHVFNFLQEQSYFATYIPLPPISCNPVSLLPYCIFSPTLSPLVTLITTRKNMTWIQFSASNHTAPRLMPHGHM